MLKGSSLDHLLTYTNGSAVQLWGYVLLRVYTLYKALHPLTDPSNLPLCPARHLLLGHPYINILQYGLLRYILLRGYIQLHTS